MKNYEKIKEMSEKEMMKFFYDILPCDNCFINENHLCNHDKCTTSIKNWLEREAEE